MPEARRENYLNDHPSCPPTTGPGLMPEARRETLSETTAQVVLRQQDPGLIPEARRETLSERSQVILR